MSEEKKLFKDEPVENKEKVVFKNKWFVYLVAIKVKLNILLMWITIIINGLLIILMLSDFNVGIILFLLNQYLVIAYYIKTRKERMEKNSKKVN